MEPQIVGLIGVCLLLILLVIGMPIAFAGALTGLLGCAYLVGFSPAVAIAGLVPLAWTIRYTLTLIPLFMFMGYLAFYAGFPTKAFEAGRKWFGHIPGGEAMATITGCAAFAACSGSAAASNAIFGRVAIPEMEKRGYSKSLSAGVVAASGTFASMIPPSGLMVIYAVMAETSVGKQLMAGLLPGAITAVFYAILLYSLVKLKPSLAYGVDKPAPWKERFASLSNVWGIFLLAVIVVGGIYTGVFTPTESGAAGAFAALILFLFSRTQQPMSNFKKALMETGRTTAMIFLLLIGIMIFARFIAFSRITYDVVAWIGSLDVNRYIIIAIIMLFYLILGMFLEAVAMLILTLSVVIPIVTTLGFDLIWFGVFLVKMTEVAAVTPPVGIGCYIVKGVCPHISLGDIFRGAAWFIMADVAVLILLVIWPEIALLIPNSMKF